MSPTTRSFSFKSDSTYCSFYEDQKKRQKKYPTQKCYMNDLKDEIERHLQGIQLLANEQIIMHMKKLKTFKRHKDMVSGLKRTLYVIYNHNKKLERMLTSDSKNGYQLPMYDSNSQKDFLPLLKPLIGDNSDNLSASFPSAYLTNKNFIDSNATLTTNTKTCSDIQEFCSTKDGVITITTNNSDNFMDSDTSEKAKPNSLESNIESTLESSNYDSSPAVFNTKMLSNGNFIVENSGSSQSDVEHQMVPNSPNVPDFNCIEKTSAHSQLPHINHSSNYKKVFIFDSSSNIWRESEYNISSSGNSMRDTNIPETDFQSNGIVISNVLPKSDDIIFKKPSNISIKRRVSSRSLFRQIDSEDEQRGIIDASYSTAGEGYSHLSTQKEIISDTFKSSSPDGNAVVNMTTTSSEKVIINDTYITDIENPSGNSSQSKGTQAEFQFHSNSNSSNTQHFAVKEIICDSLSDSNNSLGTMDMPGLANDIGVEEQVDSKNTHKALLKHSTSQESMKNIISNRNLHTCQKHSEFGKPQIMSSNMETVAKDKSFFLEKLSGSRKQSEVRRASILPDINNNTGAVMGDHKKSLQCEEETQERNSDNSSLMSSNTVSVKKSNSFVHVKAPQPDRQSQENIRQLQKFNLDSKMASCYTDDIIENLSHTFSEVMTLAIKHNKNNIYKKMLMDVDELEPANDPKASLDMARVLRGTVTLQYKQMVRRLGGYLMHHNNSWEEFNDKMQQVEEITMQAGSVLPQVIQASLTEKRLNADFEFKEYLKSDLHNFTPEDSEEVIPHQIFCDHEAEIEEIAASFRQQLKDENQLHDPDVHVDNDDNVDIVKWMKIAEYL